jgi:hypothetical protein
MTKEIQALAWDRYKIFQYWEKFEKEEICLALQTFHVVLRKCPKK